MVSKLSARRVLAPLAVVCIVAGAILGGAQAAEAASATPTIGEYTYQLDDAADGPAKVISYSGVGGAVTVPGTVSYNGHTYTVTGIDANVFHSRSVTSASIPSTVTFIGGSAFEDNSLTSITLPADLNNLSGSAFAENQLTSVTLPVGVTRMEGQVFARNLLTSVTFQGPVTLIGAGAFQLNQFSSIVIPDTVTEIGGDAYEGNNLTSIVIPGGVTAIDHGAFEVNPLTAVHFEGAAPTSTDTVMFGAGDPTIFYAWRYGSSQVAGGFTPLSWQGYPSQAVATVTFDGNGGSGAASESVDVGDPATAPADPARAGHVFAGWYTAASGGSNWNFATAVSGDLTLFAHWSVTTTTTGLAFTGVTVSPWVVAGAIAIVLLGIALVLIRRRPTRRS
jgi:uncharacterized repeat protein (TIGR02543 family)